MKILIPAGIGIARHNGCWHIVVCRDKEPTTGFYSWDTMHFGYSNKKEAKARANYISSYLNVPYISENKVAL